MPIGLASLVALVRDHEQAKRECKAMIDARERAVAGDGHHTGAYFQPYTRHYLLFTLVGIVRGGDVDVSDICVPALPTAAREYRAAASLVKNRGEIAGWNIPPANR